MTTPADVQPAPPLAAPATDLDEVAHRATLAGWRHITTRRAVARDGQTLIIASSAAWPDILAWRPGRIVAVWATAGRLDSVRRATADSLTAAGVDVHLWNPDEQSAAEFVTALGR